MDAIEIAAFLDEQHTGVLSLAKDDDGYAIPVSFTYDDEEQHVYLRLGYTPDSQKRDFLDASHTVTFVVYDRTDAGWTSVLARGRIVEVTETRLDASILESVHSLDIPFFAVHAAPADELEFTIARLEISELSGIVEGQRGH